MSVLVWVAACSSFAIQNGTALASNVYPGVGRLLPANFTSILDTGGSAVVISDRHVLTAAHCIWNFEFPLPNPAHWRFQTDVSSTAHQPTAIHMPIGWVPTWLEEENGPFGSLHDIATLEFPENTFSNDMVTPIYEGGDELGADIVMAGCGWTSTQDSSNPAIWTYNPNSQGVRRQATNVVSNFTPMYFENYGWYNNTFDTDFDGYGYTWNGSNWNEELELLDSWEDGGPTTQEGQLKKYDSGGPSFATFGEQTYVIGIHWTADNSPFF